MGSEELLKKKSILVVEDDEVAHRSLVTLTGRLFGTVHEAFNGKEGLEMVRKHTPDIVLTDLEMPFMKGKDMIEAIRSEYPTLPIIVVTAFADEAEGVPMADKILIKPVVRKSLKEALIELALRTEA